MTRLLDRVGPEAGHAFTKELNEVVHQRNSIMPFTHSLGLLRSILAINKPVEWM
jgi:hypothetical protein